MPRRKLTFALLAVAVVLTAAACGADSIAADVEEAEIVIRYSKFDPAIVHARAGEPMTITVRNDDPIAHEWLVGDEAMHARHRTGTEPYHDEIPTEVTVPAFQTRVTTVTFDEPGDYRFICHLPGHESYGMVGVLRVAAAE